MEEFLFFAFCPLAFVEEVFPWNKFTIVNVFQGKTPPPSHRHLRIDTCQSLPHPLKHAC
jgi:hypothetical protein